MESLSNAKLGLTLAPAGRKSEGASKLKAQEERKHKHTRMHMLLEGRNMLLVPPLAVKRTHLFVCYINVYDLCIF